jgi:glucose uptake protein
MEAMGMFLPETYQATLFLMLLSMLCWGSWANTEKMCPRFRFQLYYWDYAIGMALAAVLFGLTAGSFGQTGLPVFSDMAQTPLGPILYAACGGVVFNVANLLLVAAIDVRCCCLVEWHWWSWPSFWTLPPIASAKPRQPPRGASR